MTTEGEKQTKKLKVKWEAFLKTRFANVIKAYFGYDDLAALIIMLIGALYYWENGLVPYNKGLREFYENIHTELIGLGITVLIIGNANQYLQIKAEQRRLILQMGSPNNDFAIEAIRQLRQRGWLNDGTIKEAYLRGANLDGAELDEAHLEGVYLRKANLKGAKLWNANLERVNLRNAHLELTILAKAHLERANLRNAHLEGADLKDVHLEGADLRYAHLEGVNFGGATYDEKTNWIGAKYDGKTIWPNDGFDPEVKGLIKEGIILFGA